jgi:hypothetical protein
MTLDVNNRWIKLTTILHDISCKQKNSWLPITVDEEQHIFRGDSLVHMGR